MLQWHRPRFYSYRAAMPGCRVILNDYPEGIIGVAVVVGQTAYAVKWASVGRLR